MYVVKRMPMGGGEIHFVMRSRKRARSKEKRHEHLVMWSPREGVLLCTCPGWNYRRICSGTRMVILGLVK